MADFDFTRFRMDDGRSRNDPDPFRRELPASVVDEHGGDADGTVHQVGVRASDGDETSVLLYADGSRLRIATSDHDEVIAVPMAAIDEMIAALSAIRDQQD